MQSADHIEATAVGLVREYFFSNGLKPEIYLNDKTKLIDGFIIINGFKYDVQVKGTINSYQTHDIEQKYFEYGLKNYYIYIIVEKIEFGLKSPDQKIFYKVLDVIDCLEGLNNKTKKRASLFDFNKLDSFDEFSEYVIDKHANFIKRNYHKIDLEEIFDTFKGKVKVDLSVDFKLNKIQRDKIKVLKVLLKEKISVEVNQNSIINSIKLQDQESSFKIPNTQIKCNVIKNDILGEFELIYKDLALFSSRITNKTSINISNFEYNPFNLDLYSDYIKIIEFFKDPKLTIDEYIEKNITIYSKINDLEKFKNFLISKNLYKEKYNKKEIINLFNYYQKYGLEYIPDSNGLIFEEFDEYAIAISNDENSPNQILSVSEKYKMITKDKLLEYHGYTLIFAQKTHVNFRRCLNFDYIEMIEKDFINLSKIYLDEFVKMIIFNYLLIYWEFNKSSRMLDILKNSIEERKNNSEDIGLIINYLQIKHILKEDFSDDEIDFLNSNNNSNLPLVRLVSQILLESKVNAIKSYNELEEIDQKEFDTWPIKYIYKELIN